MTPEEALALIREVLRDSASLRLVAPGDLESAELEMRQRGLTSEIAQIRTWLIDPPDLPMYEYYRFGFDEFNPGPHNEPLLVAVYRHVIGR